MAKVARGVPSSAVIIPGPASFAGAWPVVDPSGATAGGPPSSVVCDGSHAYVALPDPGVLLKVRGL